MFARQLPHACGGRASPRVATNPRRLRQLAPAARFPGHTSPQQLRQSGEAGRWRLGRFTSLHEKLDELDGRHRFAEEKSLRLIAIMLPEKLDMRVRLDAFG